MIIAKSHSGASNNHWRTEDMSVLKNLKEIRDGPIEQLPNNKKMSVTITGNTPLASSLSAHAK